MGWPSSTRTDNHHGALAGDATGFLMHQVNHHGIAVIVHGFFTGAVKMKFFQIVFAQPGISIEFGQHGV